MALIRFGGLGSRARDWQPQFDTLEFDRPWFAPDLRGHGDSPKVNAPISVRDHARDVALALDEWCPDRELHLVGLSLGSMIALELARLRPKRCASLFLVSTTGDTRPKGSFEPFFLRLQLNFLRWFGLRSSAHLIAWLLFPRIKRRTQRRALVNQLTSNDPRSFRACLGGIPGWEVLSNASAICAPAVILRPEHDFFPERVALQLATALPNGYLQRLGGVGHAAPVEDPTRVNSLLLEHWRAVEAAR